MSGLSFDKYRYCRVGYRDLIAIGGELGHAEPLHRHAAFDGHGCLASNWDLGHHLIQIHILGPWHSHNDFHVERIQISNPHDFNDPAQTTPGNGIPHCATCRLGGVFSMKIYASTNLYDEALASHGFTPLTLKVYSLVSVRKGSFPPKCSFWFPVFGFESKNSQLKTDWPLRNSSISLPGRKIPPSRI
jgi:hypothetical protein